MMRKHHSGSAYGKNPAGAFSLRVPPAQKPRRSGMPARRCGGATIQAMNMRKIGKNTGNAGKGRPKGALNKTTLAFKESVEAASEKLGGVDRLVEWAQEAPENERAFWTIVYPKLAPLQVNHTGNVTLAVNGRTADL